jgi:YggT family protein
MVSLLCQLVLAFEVALLARVIMSWFPLQPGGVMARVNRFLVTITDPVLQPVRRVMPHTGMFDLSPLIVFFGLEIVVRNLILGCYR